MDSEWKMPESVPALLEGEVQVWRMGVGEQMLQAAYALLTPDERGRAARMRAGVPRYEFLVGRGSLRLLLGAALQAAPGGLVFESGEHGRPKLHGENVPSFNVAHSQGVVLVALALSGRIGIDVEAINAAVEVLEIARTAFHPEDLARIEQAADEEVRRREFFRCWTWKEAVAKADGRGLTLDPAAFAAGSGGPGEHEVVLRDGGSFFVRAIEAGCDTMAALAVAQPNLATRQFQLLPRHFA